MRINQKITKDIIITTAFAVCLTGGCIYADRHITPQQEECTYLNAGVTAAWNPQEMTVVSMEAGVASEFGNIGMLAIEENARNMVAASM